MVIDMGFIIEIIKFIIFSLIIVIVSKQILVKLLRKLAEILDLTPKAVGNVAGFATSMPELLTVFFSATQGLYDTSIYNIISSNVINFIQYIWSIVINKNGKVLQNRALKTELVMVIVTIIIPVLMVIFNIEASIGIVPIFILLFILLYYIKGNVYKIYKIHELSDEENAKIQEEKKWLKNKQKVALITFLKLIGVGVALFIIGSMLGNTLEALSNRFNIPEAVIGIILGFVTSIPELITFIEAQKHHSKNTDDVQGVVEATSNLFTSNMLNLFVIESIGIIVYFIVS
ncbi:MAG: hypothetical protein HFJ24_01455 [Clostridia bacterium]|nr:hypothetical protein [Clostridia bacterium]MCI9274727.1 hypothetical protein [Clostridia bacterium]